MARTVLVADDERTITDLVAFALEMEGYKVIQAFDGPEALRLVQEQHPDLVLTDIMMPGMDGREVTRRIKEAPETAHIPVVLVSAAPNPDMANSKADGFIAKPFDLDKLMATVRRLTDQQK